MFRHHEYTHVQVQPVQVLPFIHTRNRHAGPSGRAV